MCTVGFSLKGFVRERGLYFCSIATLRMAMQRFLASCIIVALVTNSVTAGMFKELTRYSYKFCGNSFLFINQGCVF